MKNDDVEYQIAQRIGEWAKVVENDNLLKDFIKWYWKEIDGKPYQISAEELIEIYKKEQK
jgi:hypothetical protein